MILYIFGEDTFRSRQYLRQAVEQFKKQRDPQGYNVVFLDGKKETAGKILGELAASPFLAEKRMVVIENILASGDKEMLGAVMEKAQDCHCEERSDEAIPSLSGLNNSSQKTGGLPRRASGAPRNDTATVVIFWQGEPLGKVKEVKDLDALLRKEKYAKEFKKMEGAELENWAKKEIKTRGGAIHNQALGYLCRNAGGDTWLLNSLIEQLLSYCHSREGGNPVSYNTTDDTIVDSRLRGNDNVADGIASPPAGARNDSREIQLADVQLFLEEKAEDNVFNLVDSVVAGNRKLAFKLLRDMRASGEDDGYIFSMLMRQFKILLQMRDLFDREDNMTSGDAAKLLGLHPFVVKKSLPFIKKFNLAKLSTIYEDLLQIDIKTKTGHGGQSLLIDLFAGKSG